MSEKKLVKNNKQNTNLFANNSDVKNSYHLKNSTKDISENQKASYKNKYHEKKLKINPTPKIEYLYKNNKLKRNHTSYDDMWNKIKEHEKDKRIKFNNIKQELINKELSELTSYPHISKRSKYLANAKKRDSLYLSRSINEERNLSFYFNNFYQKNMNDAFNKEKENLLNEKEVKEKYDKFYKENIIWKKYKDESNEKIRYDNSIKNENNINKKFTFKPLLSENTKRIVKKMNKNNKEINLNQYNNLYNQTNERELLDKLRLQMKPLLSEVFDINYKKGF